LFNRRLIEMWKEKSSARMTVDLIVASTLLNVLVFQYGVKTFFREI